VFRRLSKTEPTDQLEIIAMHMMQKLRAGIAMLMCLGSMLALHANQETETIPAAMSTVEHRRLIARLADALQERYVFPKVVNSIADDLRSDMQKGVFDQYKSGPELAAALTYRIRELARDKDLEVSYSAEAVQSDQPSALTSESAF